MTMVSIALPVSVVMMLIAVVSGLVLLLNVLLMVCCCGVMEYGHVYDVIVNAGVVVVVTVVSRVVYTCGSVDVHVGLYS